MSDPLAPPLAALAALGPAGVFAALRLRGPVPKVTRNGFPTAWTEHYSEQGYTLSDPILRWAMLHTGAARWSDLAASDPRGIIAAAARFGLVHGLTCVTGPMLSRSLVSLARADRDFTDDEVAAALSLTEDLHRLAG